MALSYNLGYQESISVHPTRLQIFAGKPYSTFPNIWEWVIYQSYMLLIIQWWLLGNYYNLKVVMNLETTKSLACQVTLENSFFSFSSSLSTLIANLSSPNCAKSLAHKRTQALWAALYGMFSRIILRTQVTDILICLITSWLLSF